MRGASSSSHRDATDLVFVEPRTQAGNHLSDTTDPIRTAGPEALGESRTPREAREIATGVYFLAGFGNTTIILGSDGAAVVDPGLFTNGPRVVEELRRLTDLPVRYVIYTHGHYDHAFGTPALLEDAAARGHDAPDIVGHVNVAMRFERYAKTAGHLAGTFDAQFAIWDRHGGDVVRNAVYCPPTIAYEDRLVLDGLGDQVLQCRHGLERPTTTPGCGSPARGGRRRRLHRVVPAERRDAVPGPALRPRMGRGARGDGRPSTRWPSSPVTAVSSESTARRCWPPRPGHSATSTARWCAG